MTVQTILIGNYANDGTGDDLRTAFQKVNANFQALDTSAALTSAVNVGGGTGIFADKNGANIELKTLTSTGSTVAITHTDTTVNLETLTQLVNDPSPVVVSPSYDVHGMLTNPFNLNHNTIINGDAQTTVYGYDVRLINSLLAIALESGGMNVDLGSFLHPTGDGTDFRGYTFDFGSFLSAPKNNYNFGVFV
jgi:hypothetical protein